MAIESVPTRNHPNRMNPVKWYKHFKTDYEGITIHNNGNVKSTAWQDVSWASRSKVKASWHYSVDDKEIVRFVPWGYSCWASGDRSKGFGNSKTINIEINEFNGYKNPNDSRWLKSRENAIKLIAKICFDKSWGIDKIGTHKDRSGKNCPRVILKQGLNTFLNDVDKEIRFLKGEIDYEEKYLKVNADLTILSAKFLSLEDNYKKTLSKNDYLSQETIELRKQISGFQVMLESLTEEYNVLQDINNKLQDKVDKIDDLIDIWKELTITEG